MAKTHKDLIHLEAVGLIKLVQTHPELEYLFRHALVQEVAYNSLLIEDRKKLHRKTGQAIEETYPNRLDELAATLAHHFTLAEDVEKAIHYLHRAGKYAVEISANDEAIKHLTKALKLLETLPDTLERTQQELDLQIALGSPLTATKGYGAPELEKAFYRARELTQQVGETPQLFQVVYGLWAYHHVRAELQLAHELAVQMLELSQRQQDNSLLMPAHWAVGNTLYWMGEFVLAQEHLEQSMALYDRQYHHAHVLLYGQDQGVTCLSFQAWNLWHLGYPDQALERNQAAVALAQELAHPYSQVYAINWFTQVYLNRRDWQKAQAQSEATIRISTDQGFPFWVVVGNMLRGSALAQQGWVVEGIRLMRDGLESWRAIGAVVMRPYFLAQIAEAYGKTGQDEEGLVVVTEALATVKKTRDTQWEAELHRLKGELLEMHGATSEEVERQFYQAINVARYQQAKSLELRATVSLCRLWQRQGKNKEARQMLAEIYNWFTEGFDTVDLKEAKALLEALT